MTEQVQLTAQEAQSILAKIEDQAATLASVGISPAAVYLSGVAYDLLATALHHESAGFSEGRLAALSVGVSTLPVLRMPSAAIAHRGDIAVVGLDRRKAKRRGADQSKGLPLHRTDPHYLSVTSHVFASDILPSESLSEPMRGSQSGVASLLFPSRRKDYD